MSHKYFGVVRLELGNLGLFVFVDHIDLEHNVLALGIVVGVGISITSIDDQLLKRSIL